MRFLINATHDIRSPLTLIMGPLEKLRGRLTDPESKQDIDTIDRNAHRLLLLVNQILDERKIDKNQMRLHCEETDLVLFIHDIMNLYSFQAQERNIHMRLWVDGVDISTQSKPRAIKAWIDHTHFDKVIANLIGNAMKYTFTNGSIDVYITSNKRETEIRIIDTGEGFRDESTDKLFERFYQGKVDDIFQKEGTAISSTWLPAPAIKSTVTCRGRRKSSTAERREMTALAAKQHRSMARTREKIPAPQL